MVREITVILCLIGLHVAAVVVVYRDAAKRSSDAAIWALVVAFAPFVGVCAYIAIRVFAHSRITSISR
ncbi:MAG: hypothetical protein QOI58_2468 [Thermoanaerobaculia bacterium]|jgi:hypothetical protein|nr:hypothetical protein [Thermoanaerobaculia bacterium]